MLAKLKSLASDTATYGVFVIIGRFLTFMLTPFYANFMSVEAVGDIINIFSVLGFLNILFAIGMDTAYFRFFDKNNFNHSKKVFTHAYSSIFIFSLISTAFLFTFAADIAPLLTSLPNGTALIRIAAFLPMLDCLMVIPLAHLRMIRKAFRFSLIRFALIIIAVALNIIFVTQLKWDAEGVLWAQFISSAAGVLIFLPDLNQNIRFSCDFNLLKQMFRFGLPTIPATISGMALQVADRPILKAMTNSDVVGIYGVNYRLGIPMMLFTAVFEYAWKPFYLSRFDEAGAKKLFARVLTYFTLSAAFIFLTVGFFIEFIIKIPFFGEGSSPTLIPKEYWGGLGILPIILGGYFFNGVFNNFAAGFHIKKKTEYLPAAMITAAVINIAMNVLLIPYLSYWASAWATLAAYFASAAVLYVFARKIYPVKYEWSRLSAIIFTALTVYFVFMGISSGAEPLFSFLIRLAGVIIFIFILWFLKFFRAEEIKYLKKIINKE